MIWKGKGPATVFKNSRYIHRKETYLPTTCEAMVVGRMKPAILAASSPYQVGGQPGHSTEENIFVIMSLIALITLTGQGFIMSLVDLVAFFDREQILDVMDTLDAAKVSRKAAKCWFKLNEKTLIKIKTSSGMTEEAEAGDLVGQGTAGASLVSALNLDRGLQQYFHGSSDEVYYGNVRVEYSAWQDDIGKPSKGVMEAQGHLKKISFMCEEKGLEAHPDKTAFIYFKGSKKHQEKVKKELQEMPLQFGNCFKMKQSKEEKYLGQMLHEDGLSASVAATVNSRAGRFRGACFEIRSVIEEFTMQAMGGMETAKILLERALLPSLLHGAGNWIRMSKKTEDQCDDLISLFWRLMFKVPESTPKISLIAETATVRTKWRIWQEKLLLVKRLQKQKAASLSRVIYEEQVKLGWPGLAEEATEICGKLGLKNVNLHIVKKEEIKNAVFYNHYGNMKDKIMESKKLENISHEDFTKEQGYLHGKSVDRCRTEFRIRTEMLDSFKDNYRAKNRTLERGQEDSDPGLQCEYCDLPSSRDSQAHCLRCPAWQKHRADLDLSFIEDLVTYFRRVLAERADRDEEERKKRRKGREEEEKRRKMANKRTRGQ